MHNAELQLRELWNNHKLDPDALTRIQLTGSEPVLPSSFSTGTAAQVSIAAAAAMAAEIGHLRGLPKQTVTVDMLQAAIECTALFTVDDESTPAFAELSGLYLCKDGWIRLHANFDHHRDAALQVLDLPVGADTPRSDVEAKAALYEKQALEEAILDNGGACAVVRTIAEWDALEQSKAVARLPLVEITRLGEAEPKQHPTLKDKQAPLAGIRVLDLTRILAGPVCGRTLAAYGADVMLINSPVLPNIQSIVETSRGKLSAHINLHIESDKKKLDNLIADAQVFVQGYRPGSLATHGLTPESIAEQNPGIVYTSLSAYGRTGPFSSRRGYDSLLQSASGFNMAEAQAMQSSAPQALPVQILDYASGFLMAFGTQVALQKQMTQGGSWHVQVSLARTGLWLRSMGQSAENLSCPKPDPHEYLQSYESSWGALKALPHAPAFSHSKVGWTRPSTKPGSDPAQWPAPQPG